MQFKQQRQGNNRCRRIDFARVMMR